MDAAEEVLLAARARGQALAEGDAEALTSLLHPGFRWPSHAGETFGREEYVRRNTGGHTVWRSQEVDGVEVVVVGEVALLTGHVADVVLSVGGEPETFRMPVTQVWVRTDNTWSCLGGHAGPRLS